MFCTNCGQQIPDDTIFCMHCGAKVEPAIEDTESSAQEAVSETESEQQEILEEKQERKETVAESKPKSESKPVMPKEVNEQLTKVAPIYKEMQTFLKTKPVYLWWVSVMYGILICVGCPLCGLAGIPFALLITAGMVLVFLDGYRGEKIQLRQVFVCFRDWETIRRILGGIFGEVIRILPWLLLPVIGWAVAISKYYSWRMVPYILMQEPDVTPKEALKLSAQRTKGYKAQMFGADLLPCGAVAVAITALVLFGKIPAIGKVFVTVRRGVELIAFLFLPFVLGILRSIFHERVFANAADIRICPECKTICAKEDSFCIGCGHGFE